jgi:hypothetical protein
MFLNLLFSVLSVLSVPSVVNAFDFAFRRAAVSPWLMLLNLLFAVPPWLSAFSSL